MIHNDSPTLYTKLYEWSSNKWNQVDAVAITLFFIALGLRLNKSTEDVGHVLYALDAGLWILRLLDVFYAHKTLGPYVVMIYRMVRKFWITFLDIVMEGGGDMSGYLKEDC